MRRRSFRAADPQDFPAILTPSRPAARRSGRKLPQQLVRLDCEVALVADVTAKLVAEQTKTAFSCGLERVSRCWSRIAAVADIIETFYAAEGVPCWAEGRPQSLDIGLGAGRWPAAEALMSLSK
jgi:hypothetical protein